MGEIWLDKRSELGKRGEEIALEYLLQQGMRLVARNYRCGHRELDLIMEDGEFLRVVEVRSRRYPAQIEPLESVDERKRRNIVAAARKFWGRWENRRMLSGGGEGMEIVFDVVSIIFNGELFKLEHIKGAFAPTW